MQKPRLVDIFFEPNSSSRLLPFLFPAAAGVKKKLLAARVVSMASVTVRIVLRLLTPFCSTDHKLENVGLLLVDYLDMHSLGYCSFKGGEKYQTASHLVISKP